MIPGDGSDPRLRETIEKIRAASSPQEAEEIMEQARDDYEEQSFQRWSESPRGLVSHHMAGMSQDDLRFLRDDIDHQLHEAHTKRQQEAGRELHELKLVVAEYMGCSKERLNSRGRELAIEERKARERQREQDQADARAAVERGEINDVSEYIPF